MQHWSSAHWAWVPLWSWPCTMPQRDPGLSVLDVTYAKASYKVLQRAMHIHPAVAEFIPTMLDDLRPP